MDVGWHDHVPEYVFIGHIANETEGTNNIGICSSTKWKMDTKIRSPKPFRIFSEMWSATRYPLNINILF